MAHQPILFTPFTSREVTFRNRIVVSPMCQYSSEDGFANDWHLVHLGARAAGGAGLVLTEATAVVPEGRISPHDLGIWKDAHLPMLERIVRFIDQQGAVAGMQLAHAGRKASISRPWDGAQLVPAEQGGWTPVAPSAVSFDASHPAPRALDESGIRHVLEAFAAGAARALKVGFRVLELHAAHGYLLHSFLSPLSNFREDNYGGSFENRVRIVREAVQAIRSEWPAKLPLFVRLSATDWTEGGWDLPQSIDLARLLSREGADLIDCSSGGVVKAKIPVGPGYQTPFAEAIRRDAHVPTGAVGVIRSPEQAEHILQTGQADLVVIARELLRQPHWPLAAAKALGATVPWPVQYERAQN